MYELKTTLKELKEKDDCFEYFPTAEKFIKNKIKKSMEGNKITLDYSDEDKCMIL